MIYKNKSFNEALWLSLKTGNAWRCFKRGEWLPGGGSVETSKKIDALVVNSIVCSLLYIGFGILYINTAIPIMGWLHIFGGVALSYFISKRNYQSIIRKSQELQAHEEGTELQGVKNVSE
jgi:hypothetical protein